MNIDITKAWKNAQYRESLTSEEYAQVPQNPIGALELADADLSNVTGACGSHVQVQHQQHGGYQFGGYQFGWHHHSHRRQHHFGGHHSGGSNQFCDGNQFGGNWFGGQGGCEE